MFNRQLSFLAVMFVLSFGASGLRAADPTPSGYSVSVDFTPAPGKPDTYVVMATISDVVSNEVLSSPKIITKKGEPAKIMSGSRDVSFSYTMELLVENSGKSGSYTFTAKKSGIIVSILKSSISIQ